MKKPKIEVYETVGNVERPTKRGYVWHQGYSLNGNTYPWRTKREARSEAKSRGAKAVFVGPGEAWTRNGICPECGMRAITVGRCLACGWRPTDEVLRAILSARGL
jgi:hypothetical protein